jgi:hypothetical protein
MRAGIQDSERLGDVVIRTEAEAAHLVLFLATQGQQ